jgi:uncharacterized damage-inducible protein DinB
MRTLFVCLLATASLGLAQDNPLSTFNKRAYGQVRTWVLRSAEKMPEENYSFKPSADVRSFGQVVAHAADAQYLFCSMAAGEKNPSPGIEKNKTSKADIIAGLKEAYAYCDKVYDAMTDTSGTQTVKMFGGDTPKFGVLTVNIVHTAEHYGNLVTYMRMKNVVPPSSEAPPSR